MTVVEEFPDWKHWDAPAEGQSLHSWQAGRCAWCGDDNTPLVRDHCHMTGLVRGLLCRGCNVIESSSRHAGWDGWRTGDNPASAAGHYEIYVNHMGMTPVGPRSTLGYYSHLEREAWFELIVLELAGGAPWPADAPWTDAARARKAQVDKQNEEAFARLDALLSGGAA